jgi:arylformamidase
LTDPAWLEAQYDNRARVPEHVQIFERWRAASELARSSLKSWLDVPYGDGAGEALDIFEPPPQAARAPVLVFIHGGYWRALDKADHSFIAPSFVQDGALVIVPNYALCPAVTIEHIALQMARMVAWVYEHAAQYGGDPSRIALVGHSVGAHLAAMLLCCRWKDVAPTLPPQLVTGALAISGLYDLEPLRHAPFLQADLQLTAASVKRLSPAFFPRPKRPLYAAVGADESAEYARHTRLIRDQWGPTAVPICETLARTHHYSVMTNLADPAGRLHHLALRLLGLG